MIQDAAAGSFFYSMPAYSASMSLSSGGYQSMLAGDGTLSDAALADYCSRELRRMARAIDQYAQMSTNDDPAGSSDAGGGSGGSGGADGSSSSGGGGGGGGGDATNLKLQTLVSNYQATVTRFSTMLASHGETKKSVANNTK